MGLIKTKERWTELVLILKSNPSDIMTLFELVAIEERLGQELVDEWIKELKDKGQ